MLHEVMEHFRLAKEFRRAGYFETEASKEIFRELKTIIEAGHLVALPVAPLRGDAVKIEEVLELEELRVKVDGCEEFALVL